MTFKLNHLHHRAGLETEPTGEERKRGGPGTAGEDQWRRRRERDRVQLPMPRPEKLKKATITGHYGFAVEKNSVRELT